MTDTAYLQDGRTTVSIPVTNLCAVSIPIPDGKPAGSKGSLRCSVSLPVAIPGLTSGGKVTVTVGTDGTVTRKVSFTPSDAIAEAVQFARVAAGGFPRDECLCDQKLPGWPLYDTVSQ
jgi:hypothetical protein